MSSLNLFFPLNISFYFPVFYPVNLLTGFFMSILRIKKRIIWKILLFIFN
ncbi:hypothetical protein PROPEN_02265 [Proteus penneri ATCC 35198]|nr:hypothetical protein PROPEN_02265 [Proteus penneri ATCC 35198]